MKIFMCNKEQMFKKFFVIFLTLFLMGCKTLYPPTFDQQTQAYTKSIEQYQINQLFTNVIRSSENRPIAFVEIPSVLGNASSASSLGGSFSLAETQANTTLWGITNLTDANLSPNQSYSQGFTFTQSSLDNAVFWKEFLSTLNLEKTKYFGLHTYPKELIFKLLIENLRIVEKNGDNVLFLNNPLFSGYNNFNDMFNFLIDNELTLAESISGKNEPRFCIARPPQENSQYRFEKEYYCNPDQVKFPGENKLIIYIRSSKDIFDYLGKVVKAQHLPNPVYVEIRDNTQYVYNNNPKNNKILVAIKNPSMFTAKYAETYDLRGVSYIIPAEDNGFSQTVISILHQLVILTKIPGSAGQTPGILVR